MHRLVEPNSWILLRLTSSSLKIFQAIPNTAITLPKYGSFSVNLLLSRPYFLTYELLDRLPTQKTSLLRLVSALELNSEIIADEDNAMNLEQFTTEKGIESEVTGFSSKPIMRSNREIVDSASRQTLTMAEIEDLKKIGTDAGKGIIEKLISSHVGIEQKTAFSLAKYKLLKTKKYLKRFTVLPVDVPLLTQWMMEEKDAAKILEIREEMLALIGSWANVHFSSIPPSLGSNTNEDKINGRWLVVDETGGLLTASIAERMGILYPKCYTQKPESNTFDDAHDFTPMARTNTITLVHNNTQPNLSLLKYFSFLSDKQSLNMDSNATLHPLSASLHLINWLQLLDPSQDSTYSSPIPLLSAAELSAMKSNRRTAYYRKLRRWKRTQYVVSETLRGGFDGLAVVSQMDPVSLLKPLLPLLRGGAQVCIYSPCIEPLVELADLFSTSRRTAFIQSIPVDLESVESTQAIRSFSDAPIESMSQSSLLLETSLAETIKSDFHPNPKKETDLISSDDFPLNPTLLLNSTVQSARIREWQVLPGRTHPVMTGRGGAEGYLFTGIKVLPAQGRVESRGKFSRKRAVVGEKIGIKDKKLKSEK
ncbi:tRNA (adenine(58)-N(1))-methyltransferase non-catalytic subunit trm6 [Erysiphe necator]|uniref:tRNA (adenine(58)-N(1))-methyltransferase non-catalytic subunit TRM6 n=1 Tax=Uncinula necator TaxID=52586 RepID=A0A0B1P0V3_UNCNE|nr:tRNA (adenine(58)-N(1))-methyltransferase non-catalytic subunit trm6 [Erysiphe necator]KHJ30551.1 putative trna (adenine-n -)-methyltransferase non-catalytic subunit trm6 [Erysiphe necator]